MESLVAPRLWIKFRRAAAFPINMGGMTPEMVDCLFPVVLEQRASGPWRSVLIQTLFRIRMLRRNKIGEMDGWPSG